ncbi:hypothetical protein RI129_006518 [Pyrocoelia pectoralis]|uniref:Major facilitator superfamily (MFS) profile domain-containing protein n=1 Tax=Pyrocoelia pectoralis TaxID=417401 RepID=A0AAN7ZNV7_9COLE
MAKVVPLDIKIDVFLRFPKKNSLWPETRLLPFRWATLYMSSSLIALSDGMQAGWSSPIIPRLLLPSSPIKIDEDYIVWIENTYMIGGLFGLGITIYLLDKIGRKKTILVAAVQSFLAWVVIGVARTPWMLLLGRLIAGISGDINYITTPVYISEISHKSVRGSLGSTVYIMMHVGILLVYCIGPYISILNTSIVGAVINVVQFLTFLGMPESPYYLLMKEREEEARKSLVILRASKNVEEEFKSISESVNEENRNPTRLLDLFSVKTNRKGLMITIVLNAVQDFSGMTVLVMNLQTILDDMSSTISPTFIPIIFMVFVVISSITGAFLMDSLEDKNF